MNAVIITTADALARNDDMPSADIVMTQTCWLLIWRGYHVYIG